ncbi:MAG: DUF4491 family protein [Synergistaceae bacterium]|nr:DUF4491 family protein [Synergistaceae bacterium]
MIININLSGIIIGAACFLIIGIFHVIVIKCEYYFTSKIWPLFMILGLICCASSIFIKSEIVSGVVGVLGFCFLWSVHELKKQSERVAKGWFPKNPKHKNT